ncbi:MAG: hypothetical protein AMS21_01165 [Gemmatimonas sp. SG8_38_2]|nr:MAG: hypothetical protein AMS21_01165 [Gemmatimonas sp. SG8_38_2]
MSVNVKYTNRIFAAGMLCGLHVGYWTAQKKLQPEDLGLSGEDVPKDLISLGRRRLMPKEALDDFKRLEGYGRRVLDKHGHKFIRSITARFIPASRIEKVDEELLDLKRNGVPDAKPPLPSFYAIVEEYEAMFNQRRSEMLEKWHQQLRKIADEKDLDDSFISETLSRIDSFYPTRDEAVACFSFQWDWYNVQFPNGESFSIGAEQQESRRKICERYETLFKRQMEGFIESVISEYRHAAAELATKWAEELENGKKIHHKRILELRNFLKDFSDMNFAHDYVLSDRLADLEAMLPNSAAELNGDETARDRIRDAMGRIRDVTSEIGDRSAGSIAAQFLMGAERAIESEE